MLELIRTIELNPIPMTVEPLRFRVEILRDMRSLQFFARLLRWEVFEMNPWPDDEANRDSVHEVLVADSFWSWKENPADSEAAALKKLLDALAAQLPGVAFE